MARKCKKLCWVEHTFGGPLAFTRAFEAVGFETRLRGWGPGQADELMGYILPDLETWRPDIILLWIDGVLCKIDDEPVEWASAYRHIRESPNLQHTKIMAFLEFGKSTAEQKAVWRERYDFCTGWPIRAVEHARVAKRLVGEEVKGFEGVNYALLRYGRWEIQDYLLTGRAVKDEMQADAEGQFNRSLATRFLTANAMKGYTWSVNGIPADIPTCLVYVIKDHQTWREGLNESELVRLAALAERAAPGYQLLVGVNNALLQTESALVAQVIELAQYAGGWRVFVNEHLWFEGVLNSLVEKILYRGNERALWPIVL